MLWWCVLLRCQFLQFLDINFDYDSIKKQYTPSTTPLAEEEPRNGGPVLKLNTNPLPTSPIWTYNDRITDSSTGYQLTQLCCCYYTTVAGRGGGGASNHTSASPVFSPSESSGQRMPVSVNAIQYSIDIGL